MKHCKNKTIITLILCFIIFTNLKNSVFAYNTEYTDSKITKEKGIGIAVINDINTFNNRYYYLFYDESGTLHTVQYIPNEISDKTKETWVMKKDSDNAKARKLGAKSYYESEDEIFNDENQDATNLYKEVVKDKDIGHAYDYIEGSEEDLAPITIESIVLNKIPIFDVNVFKDTAGGKEVKTDSTVGILRNVIASWYVALSYILYIVLAILIMYNGVRLAISTIITEKTDTYKMHLLAWLKSFMFLTFMHIIIYSILYSNDFFIYSLDKINTKEGGLYNTIKTRAYEGPWNIAIVATILYIVLFIIWLRVIWSYLKRTTASMYLIIYAPLVVGRYAIESANGKKSSTIVDWTKRFATTVLIQSIHALIYVAFISPVIEDSLDNHLLGLIIALFFLFFLLSADGIFVNIFQNHLRFKTIKSLDEKSDAKDILAKAIIARNLAGGAFKFAKGARGALAEADNLAPARNSRLTSHIDNNYNDDFDTKNQEASNRSVYEDDYSEGENFNNRNAKVIYNDSSNVKNTRKSGRNRNENRIRQKRKLRQATRNKKRTFQKGNRYITLKRRHGKKTTGNNTKKVIKLHKNKRRFTAPFKVAGIVTTENGDSVLLTPVNTTKTGAENITHRRARAGFGYNRRTRARYRRSRITHNYATGKNNPPLSNTVRHLMVTQQADRIEEILNELQHRESKKAKKESQYVAHNEQHSIDSNYIVEAINRYTDEIDIDSIDDETLIEVVNHVIATLPYNISSSDRQMIKTKAAQIISKKASKGRRIISSNDSYDNSKPEENQQYGFGETMEGILETTAKFGEGEGDNQPPRLSKTLNSLRIAEQVTERIKGALDELEDDEEENANPINQTAQQYNIDRNSIEEAINRYIDKFDIDNIDDEGLIEIVNQVIATSPNNLSKTEKEKIRKRVMQIISQK